MNRYHFLDVDVTCLEGLSSKPSLYSLFKTRFYAVVSITTPASITSKETQLANPLGNKTHAWKNSPLRFNAEASNFHDDCSMLVIQLRRRRHLCADKDVGEPLIVPVFELFESAEDDRASRSSHAVYGVDLNDKNSSKQVYLYFSYKFNNSSVIRREVRVTGSGDEGVSAAAKYYRDTNQHFCRLKDIKNAVYQLLLYR